MCAKMLHVGYMLTRGFTLTQPINDRRSVRHRRNLGARRRYPRIRLPAQAFYESDQRSLLTTAGDLTLRGTFLPTVVPDRVGSRAVLRLELPGSPTLLRVSGSVVWSNEHPARGPTGMGIRFDPLQPWQLKRIAAAMLRSAGYEALPALGRAA